MTTTIQDRIDSIDAEREFLKPLIQATEDRINSGETRPEVTDLLRDDLAFYRSQFLELGAQLRRLFRAQGVA